MHNLSKLCLFAMTIIISQPVSGLSNPIADDTRGSKADTPSKATPLPATTADREQARALLANRNDEIAELREKIRELLGRVEREDLRSKAIRRAREDDTKRTSEQVEALRAALEKQKEERRTELANRDAEITELRGKVKALTPNAAALPAVNKELDTLRAALEQQKKKRQITIANRDAEITELRGKIKALTPNAIALPAIREEKRRLAKEVGQVRRTLEEAKTQATESEFAQKKAEAQFETLRLRAKAADDARNEAVREKVESITVVERLHARLDAKKDADSDAVLRVRELSDEIATIRAAYERLQVEADDLRERLESSEARADRNQAQADEAIRTSARLDSQNTQLRKRFCVDDVLCPGTGN